MRKKEVLVVMKTMNIGGAERSLLGFLESIDYNLNSVTIVLFQHGGDLMKLIPQDVKILPYRADYDILEVPLKYLIRSWKLLPVLARVMAKLHAWFYSMVKKRRLNPWLKQQYMNFYCNPFIPKLDGHYDLAINFLGYPYFLITKVVARTKVAWIHTDYSQIVSNSKLDRYVYSKLDKIVNVSDECERVFLTYYPEFHSRVEVVENIISVNALLEQAQESTSFDRLKSREGMNLLSVGRFGHAKNFDNVPHICRLLIDAGFVVKWFLIGYGNDQELIERRISEFDVANNVVILGKKLNPYPYMLECDVYVQPSRFEGKSIAVREAQILGKPVIVTNYDTASGQIRHGIDGFIVSMDNYNCSREIGAILSNNDLLNTVRNNCIKIRDELKQDLPSFIL